MMRLRVMHLRSIVSSSKTDPADQNEGKVAPRDDWGSDGDFETVRKRGKGSGGLGSAGRGIYQRLHRRSLS